MWEAGTGCKRKILNHYLGIRVGVRNVSSGVETAMEVKGNGKNFYHYTNSKKLNKENMELLQNGGGQFSHSGQRKVQASVYFGSVFTMKDSG